ncbi:MAG: polysaccharide deacetylase [Oscillospiraceae bacterium]|nr:polysaccharide deacetylase [Oscillospiraceae bacterium]
MFGVLRFRPGRFWPLPVLMVCLMLLPAVGKTTASNTVVDALAEQSDSNTIYLTFDDGPSANTMALLDVLQEYGIRATFFVTGQYEGNTADLLRCVAEGGHSVGLHSYNHMYDEIYSYSEAFFADLEKVDDLVRQSTGQTAVLYRFPGGSLNSHCPLWLREELRQQLKERGYIYHDWNVVSGDQGSRVLSAEELFSNVLKDAGRVREGPLVILFHDTNHCATTPEAVKMVIEHFLEEGYRFLPITPETPPVRF